MSEDHCRRLALLQWAVSAHSCANHKPVGRDRVIIDYIHHAKRDNAASPNNVRRPLDIIPEICISSKTSDCTCIKRFA